MKLILIDGGPASGKNTLGDLIIKKLNNEGKKSILLDLDTYVEELCPTWVWTDATQKEKDLLTARDNFAKDIDKRLTENFTVMAIGERFLKMEDVTKYLNKLNIKPEVYLYHLSVPLELRTQRLVQRGPHSLIDLDKDQRDRDEIKNWVGYVYQNVNEPETDAENLIELIKSKVGILARDTVN